jgi:peroxiredoxin
METSAPSTIDAAVLDAARTQNNQSLGELAREKPQLVAFLRHAGCPFCRQTLSDLAANRAKIDATGTGIVLVHMEQDPVASALFARYGLADVARISDPEQRLYQAAGMARGGLAQVVGPDVWLPGLASLLTGHLPGIPTSDVYQLPGAILLHDGKILRAFRNRTSGERADYCELVGGSE